MCKACFGDDCNLRTQIQKCYTTNGEFDISNSPESLNSSISTKVCKSYNDICFTLVRDGKTILKDCLIEYSEKKNVQIDFLSKNYNKSDFYTCETPLCNSKHIQPTYCIQCDSNLDPNCRGSITDEWKKDAKHQCALELVPSGCYHFIKGSHTRRGCMAELNQIHRESCESDDDSCKNCAGDACNDKVTFQKCLHYNEMNVNVTESKMCKKYDDECFTRISNQMVQRGCVSDLIKSTQSTLLKENQEHGTLKTCSGIDDCNDKEIEHEYCIVCRDAKDCKNNPNFNMRQKCPDALEKKGCYLRIIKGNKSETKFERGCMAQLHGSDQEECRAGSKDCKMCEGDSCNKKRTFQTCRICDAEVDGENCLSSPELLTEKQCPNYLDECYTLVKDDVVKRNCIGDGAVPTIGECKENAQFCRHCSDASPCNNEVIKAEVCVSCDSNINGNCKTNVSLTSETCPLSLYPRGCFHYINETSGVHKRGCANKIPESIVESCQKNDECKICSGSNCNTRQFFERCLRCKSENNPQCVINPQTIESYVCKNYTDHCYMEIGKFGVTRDCLSDKDTKFAECQNEKDKCEVCTTQDGNACNNRVISMETCSECDSTKDEKCRDEPDLYRNKICSTISSTDREGCYLKKVCIFFFQNLMKHEFQRLKLFGMKLHVFFTRPTITITNVVAFEIWSQNKSRSVRRHHRRAKPAWAKIVI